MLHDARATHNRKLPPLPSLRELSPDDPRCWAAVFTEARLRKGWTYLRLSVTAGVSRRSTIRACTTGESTSLTLLRLFNALELPLPRPWSIATAHEAEHGPMPRWIR